jgi:cellulose synthase/poly-beta-1,6-N-acetylglucosamine synthase-like glycosyltransferase
MFSVIIIVRQMNDYLRESLPWFARQTCRDFELIVVSEAEIKESLQDVRVIVSGRASPSRARNLGAAAARGDILAFIDDDAYPARDWIEKARSLFEDPSLGAVGGPSLVPHASTFFQRVSNKVYELSSVKTGSRYGQGTRGAIDDWPTCNFFVRKKYFDAVGGFNEEHWGGEDTQLCYGLVRQGVSMMSEPDLIIHHHPRRTLKQHLRQTYFWGLWRGFMMKHHRQSLQVVFFLPLMFIVALLGGLLAAVVEPGLRGWYLLFLAVTGLYHAWIALRTRSWSLAIPVAGVTLLSLLVYGYGTMRGLASRMAPTRKTLNPAKSVVSN